MKKELEGRVSSFLRGLYILRDEVALTDYILKNLGSLIPSENLIVGRHCPAMREALHLSLLKPFSHPAFLQSVNETGAAKEHPIWEPVPHDPYGIKCLSDMMTRRQWENHPLYCELLHLDDVQDHLTLDIRGEGGTFTMIGAIRERRGFRREEHMLLRLLAPQLDQAFRNAMRFQACQANKLNAENARVNAARRWPYRRECELREIFRRECPGWCRLLGLKESISESTFLSWANLQKEHLLRGQLELVTETFLLEGPFGTLELCLRRNWSGLGFILIESIQRSSGRFSARLTARERELLHWVREGKTDNEIGIILELRTLTIKSYLKTIYKKLGVRNRIEAARVI